VPTTLIRRRWRPNNFKRGAKRRHKVFRSQLSPMLHAEIHYNDLPGCLV
jgi:hypothetical protein